MKKLPVREFFVKNDHDPKEKYFMAIVHRVGTIQRGNKVVVRCEYNQSIDQNT